MKKIIFLHQKYILIFSSQLKLNQLNLIPKYFFISVIVIIYELNVYIRKYIEFTNLFLNLLSSFNILEKMSA